MLPFHKLHIRREYLLPGGAILFFSVMALLGVYFYHYTGDIIRDAETYLSGVQSFEQGVVRNIPIYEDFITPEKQGRLRRYLFEEHMKAARRFGIETVKTEAEMQDLIRSNRLVSIDSAGEKMHYFYNVRKEHRYLTPGAREGLLLITERMNANMARYLTDSGGAPTIKIAVSSALRPLDYQQSLSKVNVNATFISTHSYGVSFDLFYDDFFVKLREPRASNRISREVFARYQKTFGFLLGDSLRRQFQTVLMETLLQLQDEGKIYAILETNQRCYHVTVLR